jgi:hypothetical protein
VKGETITDLFSGNVNLTVEGPTDGSSRDTLRGATTIDTCSLAELDQVRRRYSAAVGPGVLTVLAVTILLPRPPTAAAATGRRGRGAKKTRAWKPAGRVSFLTLPMPGPGLRLATGGVPAPGRPAEQPQWLAQLHAVVADLGRRAAHVGFHRSKATAVLRPALSGEVHCLVLANISLAGADFHESLDTLEFAARLQVGRPTQACGLVAPGLVKMCLTTRRSSAAGRPAAGVRPQRRRTSAAARPVSPLQHRSATGERSHGRRRRGSARPGAGGSRRRARAPPRHPRHPCAMCRGPTRMRTRPTGCWSRSRG